jgi:DNA repair ATPase RecN
VEAANLQLRADSLRQALLIEEGMLRSAESTLSSLESLVASLSEENQILIQTEAALSDLTSKVMDSSTSSIDKMVTQGLQYVFDDMDLEFKAVVDKYRGKTAVKFTLLQNGEEVPILDSYGGGVVVVTGVLLRVVTIMALKARRFMILDETLSHVSKKYISRVSSLLSKLCSDLGFDIVLVTHSPEFAEYADYHFTAKPAPDGSTVFESRIARQTTPGATHD